MKSLLIYSLASLHIMSASCGSKPTVIEAESTSTEQAGHSHGAGTSDVHQVICQDFLHTEKYTYLDVTENGERFWVAAPRKEVETGATYYYTGGLKKTNFKSQEYDRVFETVYLVSDVTKLETGTSGSAVDRALAQQNQTPSSTAVNVAPSGDIVKISELFANSDKYEGKVVRVKGRCVKINKMIMGRNWVHIDDGSVTGKDLTVTTLSDVPVGTTVTMAGAIGLNVDFGAGYKYEVIMQEAKVE